MRAKPIQVHITHYLLFWRHQSLWGPFRQQSRCSAVHYVRSCGFICSGKRHKTAQTDAWDKRRGGGGKGVGGLGQKRMNVRVQLELRRHRNTTVHKLHLLPLLYVNTLYLPNPLRILKRRPCFRVACNFEIIQSPCQGLGNVLRRSMAFFSRNIKVTKMHGLLFWKYTLRFWCSFCLPLGEKKEIRASGESGPSNCLSVAYLLYGPSPCGHIKAKGVQLPKKT